MQQEALVNLLFRKVAEYNRPSFIAQDPICVPHLFTKKQDIEIAAFFAAIFAWGNRTTIINSATKVMDWMENSPYEFILQYNPNIHAKHMQHFAHRTFNAIDLWYCIEFLQHHYQQFESLECAFLQNQKNYISVEKSLIDFRNYFFRLPDFPQRTTKHISTPLKKSACKRLNMYLRWMVRKDAQKVDFGIWETIPMADLQIPLDVHVANVSHRLGLLPNCKSNWQNTILLTQKLKELNAKDPAIFDYALFSLGVLEKFN